MARTDTMPPPLLYSTQQVCHLLGGLSIKQVRRMIAAGTLPVVQVGHRIFVPADALHAFVAELPLRPPKAP